LRQRKETKESSSQKQMLRCFWQANAHEELGRLQIHFIIELIFAKLASCYSKYLKALSFSFAIFNEVRDL